jgi:lipoprotein-releasing system ATP-binding protein
MNNPKKEIVELAHIYKTYHMGSNLVEVIKGISLKIYEGEIVIIKGPSGVGKSTLLHIIGGLDLPSEGEVFIDKVNLLKFSNDKLAKFRNNAIGFVFQFHHLLPEFTALENLEIPAMMYGNLDSNTKTYARQLLKDVGLENRMEHKPSELSGGEQQRVAVARALMNKPRILLADEPTGNLDTVNSKNLYGLLLTLNKKYKQTLVIVTHDDHMFETGHRIIELQDGKAAQDFYKTN